MRREEIKKLLNLSSAEDPFIRLEALEKLDFRSPNQQLKKRYVELLKDPNDLVRTQAVENLSNFEGHNDLGHELLDCFKDESRLVRGSAAETLGWIGDPGNIRRLEERLDVVNDWEKASLFAGLILLGEHHYFDALLLLIESPNYQLRCRVGNLCARVASSDEMKRKAIRSFEEALKSENSRAVETTLRPIVKKFREGLTRISHGLP